MWKVLDDVSLPEGAECTPRRPLRFQRGSARAQALPSNAFFYFLDAITRFETLHTQAGFGSRPAASDAAYSTADAGFFA